MSESIQIKLAAREFTVRRLTLRQSRAIGVAVSRTVPPEDGYAAAIDQSVGVITAALSRDYPEMTETAVLDAEVTPKDLTEISGSILQFGGFARSSGAPADAQTSSG